MNPAWMCESGVGGGPGPGLTILYADAEAEYDAIIAGLDVALARKDRPPSLPDL